MKIIGYIEPDWIAKQVAKEDAMGWALRTEPEQPEEVMAKEVEVVKWEPTPHYVLGLNIKRFKAILP